MKKALSPPNNEEVITIEEHISNSEICKNLSSSIHLTINLVTKQASQNCSKLQREYHLTLQPHLILFYF